MDSATLSDVQLSLCRAPMKPHLVNGTPVVRAYGGHSNTLFQCACCSYLRFDPLPPESVLSAYYAETYWSPEQAKADIERSYKEGSYYANAAAHLVDTWAKHGNGSELSLHEHGCGLGATVYHLNKLGAHATGADLSGEGIATARAFGNEAVSVDTLESALQRRSQPANAFFLCHVLEHFRDPEYVLRSLGLALPDYGLVVARVPNALHFASAHDITKFTWFQHPAHLHYFSPKSLARAFINSGFYVIDVRATVREDLGDLTFERALGRKWTALPNPRSILEALAENFLTMELEIVARKPGEGEGPGCDPALWTKLEKLEAR